MRMKPFSANRKPVSRAKAKNAALLNQLATPGLGSLLCGRWIAGSGQLLLSCAGCVLMIIWTFKETSQLYSQTDEISGNLQPHLIGLKTLVEGGNLFVVAWLWSAFTSFSLLREASTSRLRSLESSAAPPPLKLDEAKIFPALASVPNWQKRGDAISRTFQFKDFPAAMKFTDAVAQLAEEEWHHPDIDIRWNKVTLALTTHDAGGLTEKDFTLAKKIDALSLR
jgi:4a-hydroxytetrahydrobiopterin dehydratase